MVVCNCRKATKLYCLIHKVPVCGECICFTEHRICVIWPPKNFKDSGSQFYSQLKNAIIQTDMEKSLFGNHPVMPARSSGGTADTIPLTGSDGMTGSGASRSQVSHIVEIDVPGAVGNFTKSTSPSGPGATTRKGGFHPDRQNSDMSYYSDDEDGNRKKYSRRGPFSHKFLRALLPFWSSALPTLPVTAPILIRMHPTIALKIVCDIKDHQGWIHGRYFLSSQ